MQNIFGLKRHKGYVLSRFVRGIVILGIAIYFTSFIFSFYSYCNRGSNDMHFTNKERTEIISMLFIPIIISFMVICFYEKIHPKYQLNSKLIITLLSFQVFLLIPYGLFALRYSDLFEVISIISLIFSFILFFTPTLSDEKKGKFYKQILFVYWAVWSPECKDIDNSDFCTQGKIEKEKIYTDISIIRTFQKHFVPYSREVQFIKQHLNDNPKKISSSRKGIKMLDIGAYNGEFTVKLLNELNLNVGNIEVVEPIDEENAYRRNLSSKCSNINFINTVFEEYISTSTFDFILASHSLYSSIDNKKYDNNEVLINRLLSLINETGLIIVILGNSTGKAYGLKNELTKLILNEETKDANSCKFEAELKKQSEIYYEKISIDNYIEIDKILQNSQILEEWVSYFARVPIIKDKYILDEIKELFNVFSVKYSNLPEETKKIYSQPKGDINLLSHKTDAFFIKKK